MIWAIVIEWVIQPPLDFSALVVIVLSQGYSLVTWAMATEWVIQ